MSSLALLMTTLDDTPLEEMPGATEPTSDSNTLASLTFDPTSRSIDASATNQAARAHGGAQKPARILKKLPEQEKLYRQIKGPHPINSLASSTPRSPIKKVQKARFATPEERQAYYQRLVAPPPPRPPRALTSEQERRLDELEQARAQRAEKLEKQRINACRRKFDRFYMANLMANGDLNEKMRILADLEEKKSNPTKRKVKKLRDELVEKHFAQKAA